MGKKDGGSGPFAQKWQAYKQRKSGQNRPVTPMGGEAPGLPGSPTSPMAPGQSTSPTPASAPAPAPMPSLPAPQPAPFMMGNAGGALPGAPQPESSAVMPSPTVNTAMNKLPKAQKLPYGFNNPRKLY